jgi:predicted enzyme related to lactoylglutathione lyase
MIAPGERLEEANREASMAAYRLEHVGIVVPQDAREATMQFYESVFGWKLLREMSGVAFVGDGTGGRIEFLFRDDPPMAAPNHLAFGVSLDEFDSVTEKVKAAGAPSEPTVDTPAGDRLFWFFDPSGTRCQLVGRANPMPE